MTRSDEELTKLREMIAKAEPLPPDFEDEILELEELAERRRPDPKVEARYAELRNKVVSRLSKEGPRYFLNDDGTKSYAYPVVPNNVEVSLDKLAKAVEDEKLDKDLYDEITKTVIDKDKFARAARRKRRGIPAEVLVEVMSLTPGTGHVRFVVVDDAGEILDEE